MKILVIHTAFIGDLVLLTSPLQAIHDAHPEAEIFLMTTKVSAELLSFTPFSLKTIVYDKYGVDRGWSGFFRMLKSIRKENFDLVITPHRYFKSSLLTIFSKAKFTVGFKNAPLSWFFSKRANYLTQVHEIDRLNELLLKAGIKNNYTLPALDVSTVSVPVVEDWINEDNKKTIVVAPGSVWFTKRYPTNQFAEVVRLLVKNDLKVILIGSSGESILGDTIIFNNQPYSKLILNTIGKYKLIESAKIISLADVVISNDSSPTHLANAVRTPVVTIYGSTIPDFGFYPRGEFDQIVETLNLDCRPCGIHGKLFCPTGTFDCMKMITPQMVYAKVETILSLLKSRN